MHTPFEVVGPGMAGGVLTHPFTLPTRLILLLPSCPQLALIVARSEFLLKGAVQGGGGGGAAPRTQLLGVRNAPEVPKKILVQS